MNCGRMASNPGTGQQAPLGGPTPAMAAAEAAVEQQRAALSVNHWQAFEDACERAEAASQPPPRSERLPGGRARFVFATDQQLAAWQERWVALAVAEQAQHEQAAPAVPATMVSVVEQVQLAGARLAGGGGGGGGRESMTQQKYGALQWHAVDQLVASVVGGAGAAEPSQECRAAVRRELAAQLELVRVEAAGQEEQQGRRPTARWRGLWDLARAALGLAARR